MLEPHPSLRSTESTQAFANRSLAVPRSFSSLLQPSIRFVTSMSQEAFHII
jgi:hypothetical protein